MFGRCQHPQQRGSFMPSNQMRRNLFDSHSFSFFCGRCDRQISNAAKAEISSSWLQQGTPLSKLAS